VLNAIMDVTVPSRKSILSEDSVTLQEFLKYISVTESGASDLDIFLEIEVSDLMLNPAIVLDIFTSSLE
jgi:hypothetical protein